MSNKNCQSPGFVMVVVLILMVFFATMAQRFSGQLLYSSVLSKNTIEQQQANLLLFEGLSLALLKMFQAEMLLEPKDNNKKQTLAEEKEAPKDVQQLHKFYFSLLSNLNTWQEFTFTPTSEGCSGKVQVCISCEEGKINVNNMIDKDKKVIKDDFLHLLDPIEIKQPGEDPKKLTAVLKTFFEKRKWQPIEDPSELDFGTWFKRFYFPAPQKPEKKEASAASNNQPIKTLQQKIALTDLFTTVGAKDGLHPLLLSEALRHTIGYGPAMLFTEEQHKPIVEKISEKITANWASSWKDQFPAMHDFLKTKNPVAEQTGANQKDTRQPLEKIQKLLGKEIEPKFFSVLCYSEFKRTKKSALFIVERQTLQNRASLTWKGRQNMLVPPGYRIVKVLFGIDEI